MSRPERGTLEYEQYKAERRAARNTLTVDDPRGGRSSSRQRSRSRHSHRDVYGDERDYDDDRRRRRSRSRAPDYEYADEKKKRGSSRRPSSRERRSSRDRYESGGYDTEEYRRSGRHHSATVSEGMPPPPVSVERVDKGDGYAESSGKSSKKKSTTEKGVYIAPEPPMTYQPPAYVESPVASSPGVLPGVLPGKTDSPGGITAGLQAGKYGSGVTYGGGNTPASSTGKGPKKQSHGHSASYSGPSGMCELSVRMCSC